jgi:hypothetical protein
MKRHEATVNYLKAQENRAEILKKTAEHEVAQQFHRGIISREEMGDLLDYADELLDDYLEAVTRRFAAAFNLRRSHVSYCRVRTLAAKRLQEAQRTEQLHSLISHQDSEVLAIAPVVEVLAYSLTTHGPPPGTASKHGASRVIT